LTQWGEQRTASIGHVWAIGMLGWLLLGGVPLGNV
jgi:hypothetical protein